MCAPLNFIQRIKDLRFYGQVVIKTVAVVISRCCFAEDDTELGRCLFSSDVFRAVTVVIAKALYQIDMRQEEE